ncbi:hypothetical protein ACYATM_00555 [Lactobacillaceae bacterium Scapto_B20]
MAAINDQQIIQVLERHQNLIKVKYRGEFGYFWPSTNLTGEHLIKSFDDADQRMLTELNRNVDNTILVPLGFDPHALVFIIQVLDKPAIMAGQTGEVGIFNVHADGQVQKKNPD